MTDDFNLTPGGEMNDSTSLSVLMRSDAEGHRLVAAGVDRHVRGWEKSSDHAPTWIELK